MKRWLRLLAAKGLAYWVFVLFLISVGIYAGRLLDETQSYLGLRYSLYQYLNELDWRKPYVKDTVLVLIGDEEFWKGELARRVPLKREYLARLILKLSATNPKVIALDFDLRSPVPDGTVIEHRDYFAEDNRLLRAVKEAAENCSVVLSSAIWTDPQGSAYIADSNIYDDFDFGTVKDKIFRGYVALAEGKRKVPLRVEIRGGKPMDSFVEAIVRAFNSSDALRGIGGFEELDLMPYGSYVTAEKFPQLSATEVLHSEFASLKDRLRGKIVIVSGSWHRLAHGRGPRVDEYLTPVGRITGALVHANYVEAILDQRIYKPLQPWLVMTIEAVLALLAAAIIALNTPWHHKALGLSALCVFLVALNYLSLHNLGQYFDLLPPLVILIAHSLYEHSRERRLKAIVAGV